MSITELLAEFGKGLEYELSKFGKGLENEISKFKEVEGICITVLQLLRENSRITFSEAETAEILGMSVRTLADLRRAGRIHFCKGDGKDARYRREHIEEYLDRHDTMPANMRERVQLKMLSPGGNVYELKKAG